MAREFENLEEIQGILSSGSFEELQGTLENEFFEAKAEPWDLNSERGKLDLAKDVSSLANWRGGIINHWGNNGAVRNVPAKRDSRNTSVANIPRANRSLLPRCSRMDLSRAGGDRVQIASGAD